MDNTPDLPPPNATSDRPRVRYVDATPIEHEGQNLFVLRDAEGVCPNEITVPPITYYIMALMDGTRDLAEVETEVARQTGQTFEREKLEGLLENLDEAYLLANERSAERLRAIEEEFKALEVRPAAHAGEAYPDDPKELVQTFDGFFTNSKGPGTPNGVHTRRPLGLVTPHIDLRCGGPCMAWGFDRLRCESPADLYIILGVAHNPAPNLYTLTDKDFDSPLGAAMTDRDAAARLRELYGADRLSGELVHKREHSVEFQTVFLKYLHREGGDIENDFKILPLLCGSLHEDLADGKPDPVKRPDVGEFVAALRQLIAEYKGKVCIIAGVDLSHVGRKFGHDYGADKLRQDIVRSADLRMLEHIENRSPEDFFDHFRGDANARNVDAVAAVYTMLHVLDDGTVGDSAGEANGKAKAELLNYDQYIEEPTDSMVSFAAMALY